MKCRTIAIALGAALFASRAAAADIDHQNLSEGIELIGIDGEIKEGDAEKFRRLAVQYDKAVVALRSDGGSLLTALEIGKAIHLREFATFVMDDHVCASACALIWVAGAKRWLAPRGKVGFHASYQDVDGKHVETGVGNALVGRYLTQLELPERAIIFATSASPSSISWLRASDRATAGISFDILETDQKAGARPQADQDGWKLSARTSDMQTVVFVDTRSILKEGNTVRFWEDTWWSRTAGNSNRVIDLIEADCRTKAYRALNSKYYFGERFVTTETQPSEIDYAQPGTIIDGAIISACDSDFASGPIADRSAYVAKLRGR